MTPPERPEGPEDPRMAEFERLVRTFGDLEYDAGYWHGTADAPNDHKRAEARAALLDLARDGQRWRELRPNGYAVVTEEGAYCCEDREGAVLELNFRAKAGDELRPIFFGPSEPVTPSADTEK